MVYLARTSRIKDPFDPLSHHGYANKTSASTRERPYDPPTRPVKHPKECKTRAVVRLSCKNQGRKQRSTVNHNIESNLDTGTVGGKIQLARLGSTSSFWSSS